LLTKIKESFVRTDEHRQVAEIIADHHVKLEQFTHRTFPRLERGRRRMPLHPRPEVAGRQLRT
jgi:hypothetical protein